MSGMGKNRSIAARLPEFEHDLRFVILRGRTRYIGRTLWDTGAEEVLEVMVADVSDGFAA
jgi:hypothetical protein